MIRKRCSECGKECWHNPLAKDKSGQSNYRCTYCGYPLGTGWKRERNEPLHKRQVAKARAGQ